MPPAATAPGFVPLTILPDPEPSMLSPKGIRPTDALVGVMTVELGGDVVVRVPGDVSVERAVALVRALRDAP